jgi:hypothetical protein
LIGRNKETIEKARNYLDKNFEVDNNHIGFECDLRIPAEIEKLVIVVYQFSYNSKNNFEKVYIYICLFLQEYFEASEC